MDHQVQTVIDLLARDMARSVDWPRLAAAVRLSPSGLRLLFKQATGLPPSKFLRQLRFERARELLGQPSVRSVKEVMAAVGYSDQSHFVRDFARRYGVSPGRYRQRVSESTRAGETANKLAN